jgi:hypothetical protein
MQIQIKPNKTGDTVVVTDPRGDIYACPDAASLWSAVKTILDDKTMPEQPPRQSRPVEAVIVEEEPADGDRLRGRNGQEERVDEMIETFLGSGLKGLLNAARKASWRGGSKKPAEPAEDQEE